MGSPSFVARWSEVKVAVGTPELGTRVCMSSLVATILSDCAVCQTPL